MTYTRVRNQEFSVTFAPVSISSDTLYSNSEKLLREIEDFFKKKYPNEFLIKSHEKVGIDFFTKKISESIKKKYGEFDIITANHVCAHVEDLNDFFSGVQNLLKRNTRKQII